MSTGSMGERLKAVLTEKKISQAELARRANISKQNVGQIISGFNKGGVGPETLFGIADALEVNAKWLALGTGPRQPGNAVDSQALVRVVDDVTAAVELSGLNYTPRRILLIALQIYLTEAQTGKSLDVEQSVQLLSMAHRAGARS